MDPRSFGCVSTREFLDELFDLFVDRRLDGHTITSSPLVLDVDRVAEPRP